MTDQVSNRVGDYEILEFLGAGGMGKVFKVRNVISDRVEAMKVLLPELTAQEELIKRFLHEIKLLASLEHPNIAALHTALTIQNQFVMVMEFVEGATIAKQLEQGPIPVDKAVNYTQQVLSALSYAHAKDVIHRDIKPANMMLTPDGTIKLMDFGIARSSKESGMTMVGTTLGSLYYMSPEQVKGEPIDGRSDLYAVGISLYEMVTGHKPFETGTDYSIMAAHLKEPPKPPIAYRPDLPPALNEIILVAVAKEPAQRFQKADAMLRALSSVAGAAPYEVKTSAVAAPLPITPAIPGGATAAFTSPPPPPSYPSMPAVSAAVPAPAPSAPVPQPQPTAAAQSTYVPMPAAPASGGHRGLYMALGALVVVVGLVAAGLYVPKMLKTHASDAGQPSATTPATQPENTTPATTPAATAPDTNASTTPSAPDAGAAPATDNSTATTTEPAAETPATTATTKFTAKAGKVGKGSAAQYGNAQQSAADAAQRAADEQALQRLEEDSRLLSTRVASADASIATLKRQQQAAGYGLRGDIVAAQERLHGNMQRLESAIQSKDLKAAQRYQDLCDRDADTLDKFLGH